MQTPSRVIAAFTIAAVMVLQTVEAQDARREVRAVVEASNQFAFAAYSRIGSGAHSFAFSPIGVSTAFAMALEGARGRTANAIARTFSFAGNRDWPAAFAELQMTVPLANAVWTQKDGDIRQGYLSVLRRHFGASRAEVDFPRHAWFVRRTVDNWIAASTGGLIQPFRRKQSERITRLDGPAQARAVDHFNEASRRFGGLIEIGPSPQHATYASRTSILLKFKDDTTVAQANDALAAAGVEIVGTMRFLGTLIVAVEDDGTFLPLETALELLKAHPAVEIASMSPVLSSDMLGEPSIEDSFGRMALTSALWFTDPWDVVINHAAIGGLEIIERVSTYRQLLLTIVIPENGDLAAVEQSLSPKMLAEWRSGLKRATPAVTVPSFTLRASFSLKQPLVSMGLQSTFSDSADFSGIEKTQVPLMTSAAHHTIVAVKDNKFQIAAATAIGSALIEPLDPDATPSSVSRPFVFIVQEKGTGLILMMGRVGSTR